MKSLVIKITTTFRPVFTTLMLVLTYIRDLVYLCDMRLWEGYMFANCIFSFLSCCYPFIETVCCNLAFGSVTVTSKKFFEGILQPFVTNFSNYLIFIRWVIGQLDIRVIDLPDTSSLLLVHIFSWPFIPFGVKGNWWNYCWAGFYSSESLILQVPFICFCLSLINVYKSGAKFILIMMIVISHNWLRSII